MLTRAIFVVTNIRPARRLSSLQKIKFEMFPKRILLPTLPTARIDGKVTHIMSFFMI